MTQASKKEVVVHIKFMKCLMDKIEESITLYDENISPSHHSGTIKNLSPELSKAASKLNIMMRY